MSVLCLLVHEEDQLPRDATYLGAGPVRRAVRVVRIVDGNYQRIVTASAGRCR